MMNLGKAVNVGLAIRGKDQEWLSKKVDLSASHISLICRNKRDPKFSVVLKIAHAFDVDMKTFSSWGELDDVKLDEIALSVK